MTTTERATELVERYIALWNDPDPSVRRKLIRDVWTPDGGQVLVDVPEEIRDAARNLDFPVPSLEVWGYDALEGRVDRAYEMFLASGQFAFRRRGEVTPLLGHVVAFNWDMVDLGSGERAAGGADVFVLAADGRVRVDYQGVGDLPTG